MVCSAVSTIHARGVIHHDIKCENILINDEEVNSICVADFGEAELKELSTGRSSEQIRARGESAFFFHTLPEVDVG